MKVLGLGTAAMDIVLQCASLPREDGFAFIHREQLLPGGSCANVLTALTGFGVQTSMIAAVGDDTYGAAFKRDLEMTGIIGENMVTRAGGTTLHTFITVANNGSRAIFANLGDSLLSLREDEVGAEMLDGVDVFYTDMFPGKPALKLARLCKQMGIPVVFNLECAPSFMELCGVEKAELETMLSICDLFLSCREGLLELAEEKDYYRAARSLFQRFHPPLGIIATMGEEGAAWIRNQHEEITARAFRVDAIDTTGAGDALAGGLIYAWFGQGLNPEAAIDFASASAAIKCTQLGARLKASVNDVLAFLAQAGN